MVKKSLMVLAFFGIIAFGLMAFAQVDPSAPEDVAKSAVMLIDGIKAGSWIGISSAAIWLLLYLFRLPMLGELWKKIPKRWRILIPILLGAAAGALSKVAGGMPWPEAISIVLFTGPSAIFAHQAVYKALLGKSSEEAPK